jgi:hypothetical protein
MASLLEEDLFIFCLLLELESILFNCFQ